jgi:hypothetical protein
MTALTPGGTEQAGQGDPEQQGLEQREQRVIGQRGGVVEHCSIPRTTATHKWRYWDLPSGRDGQCGTTSITLTYRASGCKIVDRAWCTSAPKTSSASAMNV